MNGQIIIACLFHVMIIDLTDAFYAEAATSRTARTQSNWHSSLFIKTATSYLADLTSLYSKLNDLEKCTTTLMQVSDRALVSREKQKPSASSMWNSISNYANKTSRDSKVQG